MALDFNDVMKRAKEHQTVDGLRESGVLALLDEVVDGELYPVTMALPADDDPEMVMHVVLRAYNIREYDTNYDILLKFRRGEVGAADLDALSHQRVLSSLVWGQENYHRAVFEEEYLGVADKLNDFLMRAAGFYTRFTKHSVDQTTFDELGISSIEPTGRRLFKCHLPHDAGELLVIFHRLRASQYRPFRQDKDDRRRWAESVIAKTVDWSQPSVEDVTKRYPGITVPLANDILRASGMDAPVDAVKKR